jgi:hypothetical protein
MAHSAPVNVAEAVERGRLAERVAQRLVQAQGFLAVAERLLVVAFEGLDPAEVIERAGLSRLVPEVPVGQERLLGVLDGGGAVPLQLVEVGQVGMSRGASSVIAEPAAQDQRLREMRAKGAAFSPGWSVYPGHLH